MHSFDKASSAQSVPLLTQEALKAIVSETNDSYLEWLLTLELSVKEIAAAGASSKPRPH